jgi:hypothetical protein
MLSKMERARGTLRPVIEPIINLPVLGRKFSNWFLWIKNACEKVLHFGTDWYAYFEVRSRRALTLFNFLLKMDQVLISIRITYEVKLIIRRNFCTKNILAQKVILHHMYIHTAARFENNNKLHFSKNAVHTNRKERCCWLWLRNYILEENKC